MKFQEIQKNTEKLIIVTKDIFRNYEASADALDANIKYWLRKGDLVALKNGTYVFAERYKNEANKDIFLEYLAGQLLAPSYLSLEYVMTKYQLLTESVTSLTSISTKTTRDYHNKLAIFRYYSVTKELFCGFRVEILDGLPVATATKAKAVFDYLYLRFAKNSKVNEKEIEELRINWENINKKEFKELESYSKLTRSQKTKELINLIKIMYYK